MTTLLWIILSTGTMSLISWVGLIVVAFNESVLRRFLRIFVAFAAGTLLAGAFLHLIPETVREHGSSLVVYVWVLVGFTVFLLLEQLLHWRHDHRITSNVKDPVTYLILLADGLHNFLGGLAIGGSFLVSPRVGIITWIVAIAHEIPQEFGDFAILVNGGWEKKRALVWNFVSALTIVPGGLVAYFMSGPVNTIILLPFAAGNFIYIAASDLIPEIKHAERRYDDISNFISFVGGLILILVVTLLS